MPVVVTIRVKVVVPETMLVLIVGMVVVRAIVLVDTMVEIAPPPRNTAVAV